jgi:hypothetical protein
MQKIFEKIFYFFFRKKINDRIAELEAELLRIQSDKIEDYIGERLLIDTSEGFQIKFLGESIVRILAKCFWLLVKDSENYLIFTFKDTTDLTGVDVILVKEGQLTPVEKLDQLEKENEELREALSKYSN